MQMLERHESWGRVFKLTSVGLRLIVPLLRDYAEFARGLRRVSYVD